MEDMTYDSMVEEIERLRATVGALTKRLESRRTCIHVNVAGDCSAVQRLKKERDEARVGADRFLATIRAVRDIVHAEVDKKDGPGDGFLDRIVLACRNHKGPCFCGCHITKIND